MLALRAVSALALALLVMAAPIQVAGQAANPAPANQLALVLDPAQSKVHWTLGATAHTVHGTFNVKSGTLRLDPSTGKASGEIVALATSGESGDDSRDKKMHTEVLESDRFPDIVFRPDRVDGKVSPSGHNSVQLHGTLNLHGADHELTVAAEADFTADRWKGTASFTIPYVEWGLKNPSNFFLRVDRSVNIELEMTGTVQGSLSGK
jgi:polyisoprenoid-binding protein YceI